MRHDTSVAALRAWLRSAGRSGRTVGLVPTMGSLHGGHMSLVEASLDRDDLTVVTIFVNPLQFSAHEDLEDYPRDLAGDLALCERAGAACVFAPSPAEMYPTLPQTTVTVEPLARMLEGSSRPTHFAGVATVVAKLFSIVGPCRAYFGIKDYQQLQVVRRMALDLCMPTEIVACATVRHDDGLALSSRNTYLSPAERAQAPVLRQALDRALAALDDGEREPAAVEAIMAAAVAAAPSARLDYAAAVQADTLTADAELHDEVRLLLAVRFGRARLIDNDGCELAPVRASRRPSLRAPLRTPRADVQSRSGGA